MAKAGPHDSLLKELRAFGMKYPGVHFKSPWPGHMDLAVNDRTFAYLSLEGEPLGISCKLPASAGVALLLPFCEPAGYGLGRSGWVAARFAASDRPPLEMLKAWLDESYRAQAPKKLVAQLGAPATGASRPPPARKSAARKTARKTARGTKR
jgi:hypothetical protein